jgi:branched-chain amino acid transport system permease protein
MFMIFGYPAPLLFGQLLLGLINGAFYALLSLGLAVIFGMLNIVNFAHGALFMLGAFVAWGMLEYLGIGYWWALVLAPLIVGAFGVLLEKTLISRLYKLDHLYGLLLTFGLALIIEGLARNQYGSSGMPYRIPDLLQGATNLGFMFLPNYRAWVVVAAAAMCLVTWREDIARRHAEGRHRKRAVGAGLWCERAAHDHAYLRRRCGAGWVRGRVGRADLFGQPEHG